MTTTALTDLGLCTYDPEHGPAEVPWLDDRLCWDCADHQLDLMARAVALIFPVQVGSAGRGTVTLSTQDAIAEALSEDLLALAGGDPARVDAILAALEKDGAWTGAKS
jgi:hypothetical protein